RGGEPRGGWVRGFRSGTVPLPSVVASLPLGLNATSNTPTWEPVTRRGAPRGWRVTGFHNRTVPLEPAVASSLPSGLNAHADTPRSPEPARRGNPWRVAAAPTRTC